jgi:hypothetical protein
VEDAPAAPKWQYVKDDDLLHGKVHDRFILDGVYVTPPPGQEGRLGRNTFHGPGLANANLDFVKNTRIP